MSAFGEPGYCTKAPRDAFDTVSQRTFREYHGEAQIVLHRAAIASLAGPRTPVLALHADHSYGYGPRSSAAHTRACSQRSSTILGAIAGQVDITIGYVLKGLILPPGGILCLALLGLYFSKANRRVGHGLVAAALVILWLCSTPVVGAWLARSLEYANPVIDLDHPRVSKAQAVVVLGGGRYNGAPEYGADTVSADTLERLRYAAHIHRLTKIPLAVVGGVVLEGSGSEGALMQYVLEQEFSVPVEWTESASRNTAENAFNARRIIPVDRVILVTHAMHTRRAVAAFETAGFDVLPAPMGFATGAVLDYGLFDWLPSTSAFGTVTAALHEYVGLAWYRLRYGIKQR